MFAIFLIALGTFFSFFNDWGNCLNNALLLLKLLGFLRLCNAALTHAVHIRTHIKRQVGTENILA